ncbi:iron complex outermembrane receptor protein [Sphingobium wenxiniae]|nr:iron complex outermembrane receptor protein [Sphingobium wenxiniae]
MQRTMRLHLFCATAIALVPMPLYAQAANPTSAGARGERASDSDGLQDIVVTARRSEENIQSVPVSVTAFSGAAIAEKTILNTRDLTFATPGVTFTSSGASYNVNLTIRGQTRAVTGAGLPAVLTYFNEVPLPNDGSNIPTFDLSSAQVLKGPQGTFFGRNTTGGLVLTYSQSPTYEFGGYVTASYGNYDDRRLEGAVNVPIVQDKVALRLAGQLLRHDGYTKNMSGGPDFDNQHSDAFRASLLLEPTEWLTNLTVYDYVKTDNVGASSTPTDRVSPAPGTTTPFLATYYNCGTSPSCDADLAVERAKQLGPRRQYTDLKDPFERVTNWGISNTTTLELGGATIKNIFGYRHSKIDVYLDVDGTEMGLITVRQFAPKRQITEELQVYGTLFEDRLDWRIGGFYLKSDPDGNFGVIQTAYENPFTGFSPGYFDQHNYYSDTSKAVFGTLSIDLAQWVQGLKFNMGARYTVDKQELCSSTSPTTANDALVPVSKSACQSDATSFSSSVESKEPTYTFGLDWRVNKDVFLYLTKRRGYRGGGINSPLLGGTLTAHQTYDPEFINDWEIGLKTSWDVGSVSGRFNLSAYRGIFKNIQAIIVVPVGFDGDGNSANDPTNTALTINRGAARIQGIDATLMISPARGLQFTGGMAYTDPKYTDTSLPPLFDDPSVGGNEATFQNTPKWTWTGNARYASDLGNVGQLVLNVDYYHSSAVSFQQLVARPYGIVNARIDLKNIAQTGFDIAVYGRNLGNEKYVQGGNLTGRSLDWFAGHYGDPRTYGIQIGYHF